MQNRTRRTPVATRALFTTLAGLALVGGVAGCAPSAGDTATPDGAPDSGSDGMQQSGGADYADGEYTAEGAYVSPGGDESVTVTLTLMDDVVTKLDVEGSGGTPNARLYQKQFIEGVQNEVVGKRIDELNVSKIGGSSLTSGGFNEAIAQIEEDAQ